MLTSSTGGSIMPPTLEALVSPARRATGAAAPHPFTRLDMLDGARGATTAAGRLREILRAAPQLRDRILASGPARRVRTASLVTFPYPTAYGLAGAALSPAPYVMMTNRMQVVDFDAGGRTYRLLVNPTDHDRNIHTPFFKRELERYGETVVRKVLAQVHSTVERSLTELGVDPASVDFITYDHLHTQDLRGLLGCSIPGPNTPAPLAGLLPRAKLLVQRAELALTLDLHPLQRTWYAPGGLLGVDPDRLVVLDGDYLLGNGVALVFTPGHTVGNHSIVLSTERGLWTISENGIATDAYAPHASRIPGVAAYARREEVEVILNSNTREATLEQYTSMKLELALCDRDPVRPEFPQHFPSSELTPSWLSPGLSPTYTHGGITSG
jgi:hypothetical protein